MPNCTIRNRATASLLAVASLLLPIAYCPLPLSAPLAAQKQKREPLTEKQQEEIAEAGIDPVVRVNLYVKFINDYSDTIKGLVKRANSSARVHRIDDELQDFSALMDELGDNLDVYSERKADLRKSLKDLNESIQRWQSVLHDLPSEPGFEVSLKDAVESANDLSDQARQITTDQEAYFKAHPDEKGQDRAEPK
jgi:methyl-accepting chemotaxis protein